MSRRLTSRNEFAPDSEKMKCLLDNARASDVLIVRPCAIYLYRCKEEERISVKAWVAYEPIM